jgi:3-hydroxybutyryl-CoA dehydrogenase
LGYCQLSVHYVSLSLSLSLSLALSLLELSTSLLLPRCALSFRSPTADVESDYSKELCGKASKFAEKLMAKNVKKGKMEPAAMEAAMSKLTYTTEIEDLADREFVVEAATENPDVKFDLFRKLDTVLAPDVILATNTSSISITRIAAATSRPDKVIGTHFFNPVPVMKLVEVIPGIATSKETLATSMELAQSMNKTCVEARDVRGVWMCVCVDGWTVML